MLGGLESIPTLVRQYHVGEVIIAWPGISHPQLVEIVTGCTRQRVDIKIFPDIFELMAREVETSELTGLPLMRVRDVALRGWMRFLKRALDVAVSVDGARAAVAVHAGAGVPGQADLAAWASLHVQERVGLDGKPFFMLKFRSMRPDAEASHRAGLGGAERPAPDAAGRDHSALFARRVPAAGQRAGRRDEPGRAAA